jgi:hypothetical protein
MRHFHVIAAILRLSTKYKATRLRTRVINQLLTAYPMTLEEFDNLLHDPNISRVETFDGMEVAVVNLGEEMGIPQILPSAYYKLVGQVDDRFLINGVENPYSPNSGREILGQRAALHCMIGREAMRHAMMRGIYGFVFDSCPYRVGACHSRRIDASHIMDDGLTAKRLGPFHGGQVDVSALCTNCQAYVREYYVMLRKQAWEQLPSWFELPSWEELLTHENYYRI